MEIEEVFKSPFKLVFSCSPFNSPIKLPGMEFNIEPKKSKAPQQQNKYLIYPKCI